MSTNRTIAAMVLAAGLMGGGLMGCSDSSTSKAPPRGKQAGLTVLCSTYPMYLFTRQVAAGCEDVNVELLLPAGVGCPHDYALTPGDMRKFTGADVIVYNGLGLDDHLMPARQATQKYTLYLNASADLVGRLTMSLPAHSTTTTRTRMMTMRTARTAMPTTTATITR